MKKSLNSFICLMISISIVLSMFMVFASAENKEENTELNTSILLNRTFDEGWNYNNGLSGDRKSNNFFIDYEITKDFSYNYFLRFEASNEQDGYLQLNFDSSQIDKKHTIVEFDLKIDKTCNFGNIIYARCGNGSGKTLSNGLVSINNNKVCAFGKKSNEIKLGNEWTHIAIDYDYSDETLEKQNQFKVNIFITPKGENALVFTYILDSIEGRMPYPEFFRFGIPPEHKNPKSRLGTSYCLDNLKAYCNDIGLEELPINNYGTLVNTDMAKDVIIKNNDNTGEISNKEYLENSICMKIGVDYALFNNVKRPIYKDLYGAPIIKNNNVVVPLDIVLEYIGYPYFIHEDGESFDISTGKSVTFIALGRNNAIVDGKRIDLTMAPGYEKSKDGKNKYLVIAMDDIERLFPGYYVTYDKMGLIIISKKDNIVNREADIEVMLDIMKKFVFEYKNADEIYLDIVKTTDNFKHPFMLANQEKFDNLRSVYLAKEGDTDYDPSLKSYICQVIEEAEGNYITYATPSSKENDKNIYDKYIGIDSKHLPTNPYPDSKGYDPAGGRLNEAPRHTKRIMNMAFAYQITRDIKYLKCVYDLIIQMGTWEHWGPAHFLNCADASYPIALSIDWTYNAIEELSKTEKYYSVDKLIDILYTHGTYQGYYSTVKTFGETLWPRNQGTISNYTNMKNNWNAVCVSGMAMSSIITSQKEEYRQTSMELLSNNFEKLCRNGLGQYAPDGSYVESPVYWAYGTNALFIMSMALKTCCGSDYGLLDCWGLDKTCYFACHTESSDYKTFNYHDGDSVAQSCYSFFFVAKELNDPALANIRRSQLERGKKAYIYDLLYYPNKIVETEELPLSYYSEGIDAFTVRSSWEKGAMFAGIIGGDNKVSHGQVDSGSWVYHNLGNIWICDLGPDDYNVYAYFSNDIRYRYYRMNAEGNNCLAITSQPKTMPFGQNINGSGKIVKYETNNFGSYAIIDNTSVYNTADMGGVDCVSYARRGMMSTKNGDVLIIQDEVSLKNIQSLCWFAHYDLNAVYSMKLSSDRRTAYLNDYKGDTVRLSIVSQSRDLKFEVMDCYTFVLGGEMGTVDEKYSQNKGGTNEYSRNNYMKLAIKAENTLSFNVAVAIEVIENGNEHSCCYEWTPMSKWCPSNIENDDNEDVLNESRGFPKRSSIKSGVISLTRIRELGEVYGEKIDMYYRLLTDTKYAHLKFKDENLEGYAKELEKLDKYIEEYECFVSEVNSHVYTEHKLLKSLCGISYR